MARLLNKAADQVLPVLRRDLMLEATSADRDGAPAWILTDPLAGRYFRIGHEEINLLVQFMAEEDLPADLVTSVTREHQLNPVELQEMEQFLRLNNLVIMDDRQQEWYRRQVAFRRNPGWLAQLAKSYLFFRIPLWRPDRFLTRTLPRVRWLGSQATFTMLSVLFVTGVLMTIQQFDDFLATFPQFFSLTGMLSFFLALSVVKIAHELGHAYTAKAAGAQVSLIGVAFLVGWPVLFTDTSDAWRIPDRRTRLRIGVAGMGVELGVAIIALFLWNLMPDGILRNVFFMLATTTWVASILINLNPLMRFDGYYLLSDLLGEPNLETRSFALARWWLREKLLGLDHPPPEHVQTRLIVFAFCVWIYRFFLFLGIALLVYEFFFRSLGLVLFLVEIIYFILRPVARELSAWWTFRTDIKFNAELRRTLVLLSAFVILFVTPWRTSVSLPGVVDGGYASVYTLNPGRLQSSLPEAGSHLERDEIIVRLTSPELEFEVYETQRRYQELKATQGTLGFDPRLRNEALIVATELQTQGDRLSGLLRRMARLELRSPIAGRVVDVNPDIATGDWLDVGELLFSLLDTKQQKIVAYLEEGDMQRITIGANAVFYPEDVYQEPRELKVTDIGTMGLREFDNLYQASLFGGDIAVREGAEHQLFPQNSIYTLDLEPVAGSAGWEHVIRGTVRIDSQSKSYLKRVVNWLTVTLRRELGA